MNVNELKQKRMKLVNEARSILNRAQGEKRDFRQDEENQYDAIMADVDSLAKQIEREERVSGLEGQLEQRSPLRAGRQDFSSSNAAGSENNSEYRTAFWNVLRSGKDSYVNPQDLDIINKRSLSVGINQAGGYLVPDEFERQLVQKLGEENIMRKLAYVLPTGSGSREIPIPANKGTATWLGESEQYVESDITFSQKILNAYKMGTIMQVSEELLNDSAIDIESFVSNTFAQRFGNLEEEAFIKGDGVGKPTGLLQDATAGKVGPTAGITADDVMDVHYALPRQYRSKANWILNDSTIKAIRKLKDNDGQYIWQPGLTAGQPDLLLGRPVNASSFMPTMAAGAKSILFGDFSNYWIADRQGRAMQRLNELYASNGRVGFRMYQRVDGKLIIPEAVVYYQNAAS
ncbi:phage major capsid protein [Peribacillus frigoritolerans]|uniref:phage major capsid protein n=1 Tax=Peribacillus frigoritolerans TaxID=450367 RepID=UPI003D02158E